MDISSARGEIKFPDGEKLEKPRMRKAHVKEKAVPSAQTSEDSVLLSRGTLGKKAKDPGGGKRIKKRARNAPAKQDKISADRGGPGHVQKKLEDFQDNELFMEEKSGAIAVLPDSGVKSKDSVEKISPELSASGELREAPRFGPQGDPQIKATPFESGVSKPNPVESLGVCIKWVKDPEKREFAMNALKAVQKEFFSAPASFSGKYHPAETLGEGGLVRHIRKTAFYARRLAQAEGLSDVERDDLITAAVLHDICKGGIPWKGYAKDHGPIAEKWLENFDPKGTFKNIRHLIGMHMGDYNFPLPTPPETKMERLICEADMLGSSKVLSLTNLKWDREAEIPLGPGQVVGGTDVPVISNLRDCLDQITDEKIRDFARVSLASHKVSGLEPGKRDQFIYAMDLCRIEKADPELRDHVLAAVLLEDFAAGLPAASSRDDHRITKLKTLLQRPAHYYPEQGPRILNKSVILNETPAETLEKYVNDKNDMLKTDTPLEGVPHSLDLRTGTFDLKEIEKDLESMNQVAKTVSEHPELLKKRDRDTGESLKRLQEMHHLIHTAASIQGYTEKISGDLEKVHLLIADIDGAKERISSLDRTLKWEKVQAAAGNIEDPVSKEYFFQNEDVKPDEMAEVINILEQLRDPESDANIKGNLITPLHREEIWQTKMALLDEAIRNPAPDGKPVEIDIEYYELSNREMIEKLIIAANNGCKVRVLIDAGHSPNQGEAKFNVSDIAKRMKTAQALLHTAEGDKSDIAVALFPGKKVLGSKDALMHRKLFRVGEKVVLGGMNANVDSGENIDAAQLVEGPAAKRLVDIYRHDMSLCDDMTSETLYGTQVVDLINKGKYINRSKEEVVAKRSMSPQALIDMLSVAADIALMHDQVTPEDVRNLDTALKNKGIDITALAEFYDLDGDGSVTENDICQFLSKDMVSEVMLTDKGGQLLGSIIEDTLKMCNSRVNLERIKDIGLPGGEKKGADVLALGDTPEERQALVLHAIQSAEKFIYIPTFVMTEGIARALAAKKSEMESQGKEFDIKVIIDSGLYSYGSTPNERGFFALEEAGIPVRWSLLRCTNMEHARKIHSKEIITDKMLLTGSTNMSQKGLRTNWELSGASYFDGDDIADYREREAAVDDFRRTWNDESIEIDTKWLVDQALNSVTTKDLDIRKKEARRTLLLKFLQEIDNYEKQVGNLFEEFAREPAVKGFMSRLMEEGFSRGYALLQAVKQEYPDYVLKKKLDEVPARANLERIRTDPGAR